jgi:UDP-N-acetyl-D-glucosamine dehydrogenase
MIDELLKRIDERTWTAGVLGLGYVGLPLVVTMARAGIDTTGFDVKPSVAEALTLGRSHIDDVEDADLAEVRARAAFTADAATLSQRDVLFICVPTPLAVGKQPDISFVENAARTIAKVLRPGQLVILESTTYPGTTQDMVRPILEESGLRLDEDFLLAYSPERVDPSNRSFGTANIPRVVGGASEKSGRAASAAYSRFIEKVHPVSDARTAEMAKLLENTFRWVNIALVNELSTVARGIGVNIWEVIDAAATKPFGFMPFYPGPGVGGHCIPLDPFYLQWAARLTGESTRFVDLAETVNARMPQVVVGRIQDALNEHSKALRGSKVLVVGVAYKPNVRDHRESPAMEVIHFLERAGTEVSYADPHVPDLTEDGIPLRSVHLTPETIAGFDAVAVLCDHDDIDYATLQQSARLVIDTRNALARRRVTGANVRLL